MTDLQKIRDSLTDTCVKVLVAYRKFCASNTSYGQLILPESLKLFPLYILSILKTKMIKAGTCFKIKCRHRCFIR